VAVEHAPLSELQARIKQRAARSMCHCLLMSVKAMELASDEAVVSNLCIDGPAPAVRVGHDALTTLEGEEPVEVWTQTLIRLLQVWI
jgi:hypothetical protein